MRRIPGLGLFFAIVLAPPAALAQPADGRSGPIVQVDGTGADVRTAGASVSVRGQAAEVSAAGALVDIRATVTRSIRAAGGQVSIDSTVGGEVRAGGGLVEIRGTIAGDVYAGGAVVRFDGKTGGVLNAAGATVAIGAGAEIGKDLSVAAASITVDGHILGNARLAGSAVVFNGNGGGTVTADGDQVVIGPTAVIAGDLVIRSHNDPAIAAGAKIGGQIRREAPSQWWSLPSWLWSTLFSVFIAAGTVLAGIVLIVIARGAFGDALERATVRPFSSGLIGLATLILLPVAVSLLVATVIGLSIGMALLLAMPVLIVAGHAIVAACIGAWILDRTGEPRSVGRLVVFTIVGAVVLAVVWLVPWVGPLVVGLAILVGTGAVVRVLARRLRRPAMAA